MQDRSGVPPLAFKSKRRDAASTFQNRAAFAPGRLSVETLDFLQEKIRSLKESAQFLQGMLRFLKELGRFLQDKLRSLEETSRFLQEKIHSLKESPDFLQERFQSLQRNPRFHFPPGGTRAQTDEKLQSQNRTLQRPVRPVCATAGIYPFALGHLRAAPGFAVDCPHERALHQFP